MSSISKYSMELSGRVALITGASRGIGKAIAERLADAGALVIISSRKYEECVRVANEIKDNGNHAEAIACNIDDLAAVEDLFIKISNTYGKLDILVNNAATNPYFGPILDTPVNAFEKTVNVNMRGYFYASVFAGKTMKDNGGGAIVNIASVNALQPAKMQGIYSITKAAVVQMTKAFAKECSSFGIRVNAILPGLTETAFTNILFQDEIQYNAILENIPMKRHAVPQEIAGAVQYLVSDAASYTTGECLVVDGGISI